MHISRYVGYAKRYCVTIKPGEAVWEEPDFSSCISNALDLIINDVSVNHIFISYNNLLFRMTFKISTYFVTLKINLD